MQWDRAPLQTARHGQAALPDGPPAHPAWHCGEGRGLWADQLQPQTGLPGGAWHLLRISSSLPALHAAWGGARGMYSGGQALLRNSWAGADRWPAARGGRRPCIGSRADRVHAGARRWPTCRACAAGLKSDWSPGISSRAGGWHTAARRWSAQKASLPALKADDFAAMPVRPLGLVSTGYFAAHGASPACCREPCMNASAALTCNVEAARPACGRHIQRQCLRRP